MPKQFRRTHLMVFFLFLLSILICSHPGVRAQESLDIVPDQITIVYDSPGHDFSEVGIFANKVESVERISDTIDVIHLSDSRDAQEIIDTLKTRDIIQAVDYEAEAEMVSVPNDPYYQSDQNYLKRIGYENVTFGAKSVKVAVLDTGVDISHEDLNGRIDQSGYNYVSGTPNISDGNGHGTNVAGIIAASTNNARGIAGAVSQANVQIVPYVVLDAQGRGTLSNIAAALQNIATRDDIKIVNLSLAFDSTNDVLESICKQLESMGKIIVSSSGNANTGSVSYPARYESVLGVGSCNEQNRRCDPSDWGGGNGSNFGAGLDVLAPGNSILSTQAASVSRTEKYCKCSGTSFSSTLLTAACALAATYDSTITTASARDTLSRTSLKVYSSGWNSQSGYGILRMDAFVNRYASNPPSTGHSQLGSGSISLNKQAISLKPGSSDLLRVSGASNIIWTSSNPLVATVADGKVTALSPGTTTITARVNGTENSQSCLVTVSEFLTYEAHVSNIGWMPGVADGQVAGTTGRNLAVEALRFTPMNDDLSIVGRAHVQNIGWQETRGAGEVIGTTGQSLHIEALALNLAGAKAASYDIYYRVHVQNYGWTAWSLNGDPVGTQGQNLQVEAVQVRIVPKGSEQPSIKSDVAWPFMS